ncbi:uncharacterized protein [Atheta coriaria]|uniref:uncharacterized protein n=1 Tax=Dalotia coriaria TaxID=877792 RepID=UPI0031F33CB2
MDLPDDDYLYANNGGLRRSVSNFDLNDGNQNTILRESKSFTGALPELKFADNLELIKQQINPNFYIKLFSDSAIFTKESEYITKEISTDKIFIVNQDMLNYRGIQYSSTDIATRWKKDCRKWLWKNSKQRKNRSASDMRECPEKTRLTSTADSLNRIF